MKLKNAKKIEIYKIIDRIFKQKNSIYKSYNSKNVFSKLNNDKNITTLNLTLTSYSFTTQKIIKFMFKKNQFDVFTLYIEINKMKFKKIETIVTYKIRNKCLIFYFLLIALIFIHAKNTIISHQF